MGRINELFAAVKRNPTIHHIGARYLCGRAATDYDDNEYTTYLGRVGYFILNMQPESTLTKSSHMIKEAVANCGDYSAEWVAVLQQFRYIASSAISSVIYRIIKDNMFTPASAEELTRLIQGFH